MLARTFHPYANFRALLDIRTIVWNYRHLLAALAKREITSPYAGQFFGVLWAVGHPLFLAALYVFIFAVVFQTRIEQTFELPRDYTTYILSGLIPWLGCQAVLTKAVGALTGQSNLVRQVVFPVETLPIAAAIVSMYSQLIGLGVIVIYLIYITAMPWTIVLLPAVLLLQLAAMIGIAFLISAISVFLRDLKDFIQVFSVAGIFIAPVVYLPDWVPTAFRPFIYLNPFSYLIWCYQDVFYFGRIEHPVAWIVFSVGSVLVLVLGYRLFRSLRPHFGTYL